MNDDLHAAFSRAADDAADQAMTADQIRRAATERIRARRRRRPAFVVGSAVAGLALVGGGAFAAVQLSGDDRGELPDVIGSPLPTTEATGTPEAVETPEVPESPAPETVEEEAPPAPDAPPEPAPPAPPTLAQLDPGATFPTCGAATAASSGSPFRLEYREPGPTEVVDGVARGLVVTGQNLSSGGITASAPAPTVVLAQDGRVVGSSTAPRQPQSADLMSSQVLDFTSDLPLTGCVPGSEETFQVPAGFYEVWAEQTWQVTGTTPEAQETLRGPVTDVPSTFSTSEIVSHVWIGADGQPNDGPAVPAGWPAQVTGPDYLAPGNSLVFLGAGASRQDVSATVRAVAELGYTADFSWSDRCPGLRAAEIGLPSAAVYVQLAFSSRADADSFLARSGIPALAVDDATNYCLGG